MPDVAESDSAGQLQLIPEVKRKFHGFTMGRVAGWHKMATREDKGEVREDEIGDGLMKIADIMEVEKGPERTGISLNIEM